MGSEMCIRDRSNASPSDAFTSIIATALSASSPRSARVAAESSSSSPRRVVFLDDRPADRTRFPPPVVVVISLAPAPALVAAFETPSPPARFRSDVAPNENESSAARCAWTRTSARLRSAGNDASADARKPPDPSA